MASAAMAQQGMAPSGGQEQAPEGQQQGMAPGGQMGMNPERRLEMMQRRLGLTADQTTQVKQIFSDSMAKMKALRADSSLTRDQWRTQAMAIHKTEQGRIRSLLTPDQQTKFDAMLARHRMGRGNAGGPGGTPSPSSNPQ